MSSQTSRRCALAIFFALGSLAAPLHAQRPVSVLVEQDGRPAAGVDVRVLVEGEMWEVGVTGRDGRVAAPGDLVGLVPGDLVAVRRIACDTVTTVLLVPPAELGSATCPVACECASLGAFLWGEDIRIDLSGERLAAAPGAERAPPPEAERPVPEPVLRGAPATRRWIVGAGGAYAAWPNLDLGCGGTSSPLASCDLTSDGPMVRASVELRPWADRPLGLALDAGFAPGLEVHQRFADGSGAATDNVVETDVVTVAGLGVARLAAGERIEAFVGLGLVWAYTRAEATTTFPGGLRQTDEREDGGARFGGRAGLEWWTIGGGWGARLEAGGLVGDEDDTISGWHAGAMLLLPLGSR